MNIITKLAYNALTKTIQAIAPGGVSIALPASYKEGSWTPTLVFSGGNGTLSYSVQAGEYIRNGNSVFVCCYVRFTKGTASGTVSISGLPIPTRNIAQVYPCFAAYYNQFTKPAGADALGVYSSNNSTALLPHWSGNVASSAALDAAHINAATCDIIITGNYFV